MGRNKVCIVLSTAFTSWFALFSFLSYRAYGVHALLDGRLPSGDAHGVRSVVACRPNVQHGVDATADAVRSLFNDHFHDYSCLFLHMRCALLSYFPLLFIFLPSFRPFGLFYALCS